MGLIIFGQSVAGELSNRAYAPTGPDTSIPIGHYQFCSEWPAECLPRGPTFSAATLTVELWEQLVVVNNDLNARIAPVTDEDQYGVLERWVYPIVAGDCEDYALAKRRALADAGWPTSVLLISVVSQLNGEGHAVLLVRTDRGDFILDNQDADIHRWNETPYLYLKRQSQEDPARWVTISDEREVIATSAH